MTAYQITAGLIGLAMAAMAVWPSLWPKPTRPDTKDTTS